MSTSEVNKKPPQTLKFNYIHIVLFICDSCIYELYIDVMIKERILFLKEPRLKSSKLLCTSPYSPQPSRNKSFPNVHD